MKYATWNLIFDSSGYGVGPESEIQLQGFDCEGAAFLGDSSSDKILGYFEGNPTGLEKWNFTEVSKSEAFALAKGLDEFSQFDSLGRIVFSKPISSLNLETEK